MLFLIEFGFVVISVALAFSFPRLGSRWFRIAEQSFSRLARRQRLAVFVVGLVALGVRAAALPVLPVPEPRVADEFSYLLVADTFLHGRVTNPTPPLWIHFESFHINMRPTYQSKYPPAQGVVLAAGRLIGGHAFVGVLLSLGMMCAAICWMLQAWLPPEWALLGGVLAVMRFGVFSYWANSYWGGAVAATGGALLLGALPRIMRFERTGDALLMGCGLAILANSRPYEGFIFSLPVMFVFVRWLLDRKGSQFWVTVRRVVVPLALVLVITGVAMGYYSWRVTGSPFRSPYQVNESTYAAAPLFIWQSPSPKPVVYHHQALKDFYLNFALPFYTNTRSIRGLFQTWTYKFALIWLFFFGMLLLLPLLMVMATAPYDFSWKQFDWGTRLLLLAGAVLTAGLAVEVYSQPHYAAPMTCLILALVLLAMRHLRRLQWRDRPAGLFLTRAIPLACALMLFVRAGAGPLHISINPVWPPTSYNSASDETDRGRIRAELEKSLSRHLVIVRYSPDAPPWYGDDWVFNQADIDGSKIVWAWDMGPNKNQELIDYFKDRHVWLVDTGEHPRQLSPYPTLPSR